LLDVEKNLPANPARGRAGADSVRDLILSTFSISAFTTGGGTNSGGGSDFFENPSKISGAAFEVAVRERLIP
jgi:hypothetical protein